MSESLLLINPKRRKRRKSRKGRMPAGLRRYWASKRRGASPRRRKRRASSRRRKINPIRRRSHRRHHVRARRRRRINPIRRRSRRRNPSIGFGSMKTMLKHNIMPAAVGASGAIALDVAYAYAQPYLPAMFQTGWMSVLAKTVGAVGIGMVAGKFLGRSKAASATLGALTVVGYGALKGLVSGFAPNVKGLSGYADFTDYRIGNANQSGVAGMGAYIPNQLGFYSPAATIQSGMGAYVPGMGEYNWQNDGM